MSVTEIVNNLPAPSFNDPNDIWSGRSVGDSHAWEAYFERAWKQIIRWSSLQVRINTIS